MLQSVDCSWRKEWKGEASIEVFCSMRQDLELSWTFTSCVSDEKVLLSCISCLFIPTDLSSAHLCSWSCEGARKNMVRNGMYSGRKRTRFHYAFKVPLIHQQLNLPDSKVLALLITRAIDRLCECFFSNMLPKLLIRLTWQAVSDEAISEQYPWGKHSPIVLAATD